MSPDRHLLRVRIVVDSATEPFLHAELTKLKGRRLNRAVVACAELGALIRGGQLAVGTQTPGTASEGASSRSEPATDSALFDAMLETSLSSLTQSS